MQQNTSHNHNHNNHHGHGHGHGDCQDEPLMNLQSNALLEKHVGEKWKDSKNLKLYLYSERIGSIGCAPLVDSLIKNTQLSSLMLDLSNNNIGTEGSKILCKGISKFVSLQKLILNLCSNGIDDDGFVTMMVSLSESSNLTDIELFLTQIKLFQDQAYQITQNLKQKIKFKLDQAHILFIETKKSIVSIQKSNKICTFYKVFIYLFYATKFKMFLCYISFNKIEERDYQKTRNFFIRNTAKTNLVTLNTKF